MTGGRQWGLIRLPDGGIVGVHSLSSRVPFERTFVAEKPSIMLGPVATVSPVVIGSIVRKIHRKGNLREPWGMHRVRAGHCRGVAAVGGATELPY